METRVLMTGGRRIGKLDKAVPAVRFIRVGGVMSERVLAHRTRSALCIRPAPRPKDRKTHRASRNPAQTDRRLHRCGYLHSQPAELGDVFLQCVCFLR